MIRKSLALGISGLITMAAGACTTRTETVYVPQTTVKPTTTTTEVVATIPPANDYYDSSYELFLMGVEELYGSPVYVSDDELIATGDSVCVALWSGSSAEMVIATMSASATNEDGMRFLAAVTTSAVVYICPDQKYKFNNLEG